MFSAFTGNNPDSRSQICVALYSALGYIICKLRELFAADTVVKHSNVGQLEFMQQRQVVESRIVKSDTEFMIEIFDQLLFQPLQTTEINAPVTLVQFVAFEHEPERERIAMQYRAMRMGRPPLAEAGAQPYFMAVSFR